jgi:hypothetical protein
MRSLLVTLVAACATTPAAVEPAEPLELRGLVVTAPRSWEPEAPASDLRVAQWSVAAEAGDPEDAQVVVFFFGDQGAGDAEANIRRWTEQFAERTGPAVDRFEASGLPVTLVTLAGRYVAAVRPGAEARHDKPDFRLLAAVVETGDGPYYVRLLGPAATVTAHEAGFRTMLRSLRPAPK